MQKFELVLKNEKRKFYDRFALFIFLLNGIALILTLLYLPNNINAGNLLGVFVALGIILMITPSIIIIRKKTQRFINVIVSATISIILYWIFLGYWWIGVLLVLMIFLYIVSTRELVVVVNQERVSYPSFPSRKITWDKLNNVMLKDGLLTIDFKNDKIIQQTVDEILTIVNEKEFNEFCRQQLNNRTIEQ